MGAKRGEEGRMVIERTRGGKQKWRKKRLEKGKRERKGERGVNK